MRRSRQTTASRGQNFSWRRSASLKDSKKGIGPGDDPVRSEQQAPGPGSAVASEGTECVSDEIRVHGEDLACRWTV